MKSAWLALPGILLSVAVISSACGDHSQPAESVIGPTGAEIPGATGAPTGVGDPTVTGAGDPTVTGADDSTATGAPNEVEVPGATGALAATEPLAGVAPTAADLPTARANPLTDPLTDPAVEPKSDPQSVGPLELQPKSQPDSDLVEESESQLELIPWARLDLPPKAEITVDWTEAKNYLGQVIAVEGTVVDTYNSGRACFLNFKKNAKDGFYLAILGSTVDDFSVPPERYFLRKKVRAIGRVAIYKGRPQIVIESNQHLKILP